MFVPANVGIETEDGSFDVSNGSAAPDEAHDETLLKAYTEAHTVVRPLEETEERIIEPEQYQTELFTMPSPLSKHKFLAIARAIFQYSSLVLAPYGVLCANPNPHIAKSTMLESKLKVGPPRGRRDHLRFNQRRLSRERKHHGHELAKVAQRFA
ncbi:Aste57867_164 [Aphanomyces stellatus]|uniref:Aste57867_164 protein n=1 Tax=Aphanomyces stellatus TaxID=120398 RepID=A0A485K352_9STRA|nr:hypothetical protein As57867_000164 [Aphanomyces stellatus]VFT77390.1 Aste57867_164 [Aphanomyces stellatus]